MTETRIKERRSSQRHEVSLPVQLVTRGALEPIPFETMNISDEGVYIATDSPLPASTDVTLLFYLSTLNANVRATGTVVRSSRDTKSLNVSEGDPEGMAIEFRKYGRVGWHLLRQLLDTRTESTPEE